MRKTLAEHNRVFAATILLFLIALTALWLVFIPQWKPFSGDASLIRLTDGNGHYKGNNSMQVLPDREGMLEYEQVVSPRIAEQFLPADGRAAFGLSASTYWLRMTVVNESETGEWVIRLHNAVVDQFDVYLDGNRLGAEGVSPLGERLNDHYGAYELALPAGKPVTLHMRVTTEGSMIVPVELLDRASYHETLRTEYLLFGVYYGFVLLMAAYMLSMYIFFHNRSYLYYSFYLIFFAASQLIWNGIPQELLGENHPVLQLLLHTFNTLEGVFVFVFILCLWFALFFLVGVLELKRYAPQLLPFAAIVKWASPIVIAGLLFHWPWFVTLAIYYEAAVAAFLLSAICWCVLNGNRTARYLMLGFIAIIGCALPSVLYTFGLMDSNPLTHYGYQFGSFAEFIILAFALSFQARQLQREKEKAQSRMIVHQQELVRTLERWNEELESTVQERTEKLVQSQKERAEMLQSISHDIRAPLTVVQGSLRALMMGIRVGSDDKGQTLEKLYDKVLYMNRFMDDLFQLSRFDESSVELPLESVRVKDWITREFQTSAEDIQMMNHRCEYRIEVEDNRTLRIDLHGIRRLLGNLIHNACKFSPLDSVIILEAKSLPDGISFSVLDQGGGIPPEHLNHIFKRAYRANQADPASGSGLGLAIAKQIVERHSGAITVESRIGEGSRFTFILPADEAGSAAGPGSERSSA
ncbi:7TM diverse intracellular signaling domain-containing protein [Paenibacillus sp. NPDC058174]|uniref:sensor histidine kinase n=1 Tax=Paenibacillus sp. NPDC058174 TaxID=3346366 RepID=UPI0036D9B60C